MDITDIIPDEESWLTIAAKSGLLVLMLVWTETLITQDRPWIFLSGVNLVFHEAGHVIFWVGGEFLSLLGGTITQLMVPGLVTGYFWFKQKYFEFLFGLFWIGDNLVEVSVYIKDARSQTLELLGGGIHDWNAILSRLNLLSGDQTIGSAVHVLGVICLLASLILIGLSIVISINQRLTKNTR